MPNLAEVDLIQVQIPIPVWNSLDPYDRMEWTDRSYGEIAISGDHVCVVLLEEVFAEFMRRLASLGRRLPECVISGEQRGQA